MQDFPFAENEQIVDLIFRDIGKAMCAVPLIFWFALRLKWKLEAKQLFGALRAGSGLLTAVGWIVWLVMQWAIATPLKIDVRHLRDDPARFAEWSGFGTIGYFDCTLTLASGRPLPWSARKVSTYRDAEGRRWLWVEGNADASSQIATFFQTTAPTLGFAPPTTAIIDAWTTRHVQNRVPLMKRWCQREPAEVLLFREPNGWVTPCLRLRL